MPVGKAGNSVDCLVGHAKLDNAGAAQRDEGGVAFGGADDRRSEIGHPDLHKGQLPNFLYWPVNTSMQP